MQELDIQIICANSPQAKGRVERVIQTLQDRLPKEMRLRGIPSREAGNAYLPEFIQDFNQRFAEDPRSSVDAHRPLTPKDDLARILTWQETRTPLQKSNPAILQDRLPDPNRATYLCLTQRTSDRLSQCPR